jgi:hypothetical protein
VLQNNRYVLPDPAPETDPLTEKARISPDWEVRSETLYFQLGPVHLGDISLKALTLVSNPFVVDADLAIPMAEAVAQGCRAVVVPTMPVTKAFATMRFDQGVLRYAARYGDRCMVDLRGPFSEYLNKFKKKSRRNLRRAAARFTQESNAGAGLREYRNPSELAAFRDIAVAISRASYKAAIGWGFPENESFARQLERDAAAGRVRGYVLMYYGQPAAYAFCRIDHDVITYKRIGYDEHFAQSSPGSTLLYLILQRLFSEGEFRLFDFEGTESYPYKEFFSTRKVRCARVFWFKPRFPEIMLFGGHWVVTATWRLASLFRLRFTAREQKGWVSVRRRR